MQDKQFFSTTEVAKKLGISRIAVFNRIKRGQLKARRVGRNYLIEKSQFIEKKDKPLSQKEKETIDKAVDKTIREYGETLKMLADV